MRTNQICNRSYYFGGKSSNAASNHIAYEGFGPLAQQGLVTATTGYAIRNQYGAAGSAGANDISESGWAGNYRWYSPTVFATFWRVFSFDAITGNIEWLGTGGALETDWLTGLCISDDGYHHPTAGFR
jgi:hypothetical protein